MLAFRWQSAARLSARLSPEIFWRRAHHAFQAFVAAD
jgi:hypothetical protein